MTQGLGNFIYSNYTASNAQTGINYGVQGLGGLGQQTYTAFSNITYRFVHWVQTPTQPPVMWQYVTGYGVDDYKPETPAQRMAREAAAVKRNQERAVAESRAEQLLFTLLSEAQVKQYIEHGYFDTVVDDRTYRIKKGRAQNVELIENGKAKFRYCAHPCDMTPAQDAMLSQLLMLRTNERRFLEIANRTVLG